MKHRITLTGLVILLVSVLALSIVPKARHLSIVPVVQASSQACSKASVQGLYGFSASGNTIVGVGPAAAVGSFTSDGNGRISGEETASFNGTVVRQTFTATYTVNADCTGSATAVFGGPVAGTGHFDFVVVDSGNQVFNIQTDSGTIVTFVDKKIFSGSDNQ